MLFRCSALLAVIGTTAVASASSFIPKPKGPILDVTPDIPVTSSIGNKLLSKARKLENAEVDFTWAVDYSIKFEGCHSMQTVRSEEGGGESGDGNLITQRVVVFRLCPVDSCVSGVVKGKVAGCSDGAQYVVNMREFVDAYTEAKMEAQEWACEQVRENCYCDNANDDEVCENECYIQNGVGYCIQDENEEDFEIQRYLECEEAEFNNNGRDLANNGYAWYIGPYCSDDGLSIYLGLFEDAGCNSLAPEGTYESKNYYNKPLRYSVEASESLVGMDCVECRDAGDQNNNNNNGNNNNNNNGNNNNNNNGDVDLIPLCEEIYELAGKCEENIEDAVSSYYWSPNNEACDYIQNTLPKLDRVYATQGSSSSGGSGTAAKVFAWLFAFTTLGLGYYAYTLHEKINRKNVNLSSQDKAPVV